MQHFVLDPIKAFSEEFEKAKSAQVPQPEAMALSTVDSQGQPEVRMVLFKGLLRGGFSFFTNYNSPKAMSLDRTGAAALLFFWPELNQQIRLRGVISKLSSAESDAYFQSRPRLSQIGAWSSPQSEKIESLENLARKVLEVEKKFEGQVVPRPQNWGGYLLTPLLMEFWYGREGRLHERYVYERGSESSPWITFMRSP